MASYISPTQTWGFEVIRAIDANDAARVIRAFHIPGAHIDAVVEDSYGFYKWPWLHKFHGDTAVHLAVKWKRLDVLRALLILKPRLDIRNSKGELASDLCVAKLGVPLEQVVAEEEAKWRAAREAEEEARAKEEALIEYERKLKALRDRASSACVIEAKALLMKGCLKGHVYFGSKDVSHKQVMRSMVPELPEDSSLKHVLLRLGQLSAVSTVSALRYEVLDDEGLRLLCMGLRSNSTVKRLSLTRSRFTVAGLRHLAEVLVGEDSSDYIGRDNQEESPRRRRGRRSSLRSLDLSCNCITDEGALVLAEALEQNDTLTQVVLTGNRVGDIGCLRLVEAGLTSPTLRSLVVDGNPVSDHAKGLMQQAAASTPLVVSAKDLPPHRPGSSAAIRAAKHSPAARPWSSSSRSSRPQTCSTRVAETGLRLQGPPSPSSSSPSSPSSRPSSSSLPFRPESRGERLMKHGEGKQGLLGLPE